MSPNEVAWPVEPAWRRASFCASNECVEIAQRSSMIILRDSTQPHGSMLHCAVGDWEAFVRGIKSGKFDGLET